MNTDDRRPGGQGSNGQAPRRRPVNQEGYEQPAKRRPANPDAPRRPRPDGANPDAPRRPRPDGAMDDAPRKSRSEADIYNSPVKNKKNSNGKKRKKKNSKKKKNQIILFVIEILVLLILGIVLWVVFQGTKTEKIDIGTVEELVSAEVEQKMNETVITTEEGEEKTLADTYKQIALFGVDSREGQLSMSTRTDSIIIASINVDTSEVKLCSVYRDTYLNLTTDSYNKCNSAYAKGGPKQAINMLNTNLDLNIDNYITVGFKGVVETVNALGGVSIDISGAEIDYLNDYQYCIAEDLGIANYTRVQNQGIQTLDGLQACAYCRIRYTAGDDFKRTWRQRQVVAQMIEKAKVADPATLATIASDAFKNVSTSFDLNEILAYAADAPKYTIVGSDGFPFENNRYVATIGNKGSCVVPDDLQTNVTMLHEFLFGVQDYEPTEAVKEASAKIKSDTDPYRP